MGVVELRDGVPVLTEGPLKGVPMTQIQRRQLLVHYNNRPIPGSIGHHVHPDSRIRLLRAAAQVGARTYYVCKDVFRAVCVVPLEGEPECYCSDYDSRQAELRSEIMNMDELYRQVQANAVMSVAGDDSLGGLTKPV